MLVADRNLASAAIEAVVRAAFRRVPPGMMERARAHLRRYFSTASWRIEDDTALAAIVGPGAGSVRTPIAHDLTIVAEFRGGRFRVDVEVATRTPPVAASHSDVPEHAEETVPTEPEAADSAMTGNRLVDTFERPLVPEAGPQARIVRFLTGPGTGGQSGWQRDAEVTRDARVHRLLTAFADINGVLLGSGFVAVELRDDHRWDELLQPMIELVEQLFVPPRTLPLPDRQAERARAEFAGVNPETARGIGRVRDALSSPDPAIRQIAMSMMEHDDPFSAERAWRVALDDTNRGVRRAAIAAMARVQQEQLRGLLERALGENDACARFHAAVGLGRLGAERSVPSLERALDDNDVRVRLAARFALSGRELAN
jgi:hypothetical protein